MDSVRQHLLWYLSSASVLDTHKFQKQTKPRITVKGSASKLKPIRGCLSEIV